MKPGVKTSEFYVTMLPVVIAGLVYSGIIPESDTDMIVSLAKDVIAGVVALFSIVSYILSRSHLKREILKSSETTNNLKTSQEDSKQLSELG